MSKLVLGLDIGITSVGYGVIDIINNKFVDYGVRLFKEGTASENVGRRAKRGARRLKRRQQTRLQDMAHLLEKNGIKSKDYVPSLNPYEARIKGLNEKLSNDELTCALLHITKNRGSCLEDIDVDNESEEGTKAILSKNAIELQKHGYICKVQYNRLLEDGKIRGEMNNFKTEDYVHELEEILKHQNLTEELNQEILNIVQRRRKYYDGPGSEISPTPYGKWVDYGVEPVDLIKKMRGRCSVFAEEYRAPKNSYSAELFNLLNDLNNLTIENEKLSYENKLEIIEYVNENGGITPTQLSKLLDVKLSDISGFRVDKNEKPLLTEFKGYRTFKKIFDQFENKEYECNKEIVDLISEIVTEKKGVNERCEKIRECYPSFEDDLVLALASVKGITQYHSLSFKAISLINEEMMKSSLNQMQVLHQLQMFDKSRKSTRGQKYIYADDEAILSPVVKRAQRETFKVINRLRELYGEFDSIVIESTRDKNSEDQKNRIKKQQKINKENKDKVEEALKQEGYNTKLINGKTKLKVRLYLEQQGKTAYTLQPIDLRTLIEDQTAYEVDHIIPLSVSLDDSYNNKVLVTHKENQDKGKNTPVMAFLRNKFPETSIKTFEAYVKSNKEFSKKKKEYLLYENDITRYSEMQKFIGRNLVDTSYANRVVMNRLCEYFKDNNIPTKVHTVKGTATSMFRKRINLEKDRDEDYLHHAIDALLVASIKKLNLMNTRLVQYNINDLYNEHTGELYEIGDKKEVLDPLYIEWIQGLKKIYEQSSQFYNGLIEKNKMEYKPIKLSHKIDTKPNRQIADETIYSTRTVNETEYVVKKYANIYDSKFDKLTNSIINNEGKDKWLMYKNDPKTFEIIEKIVMNHFEMFKDDHDKYVQKLEKGKFKYYLKGPNNPLYIHLQEHGEKVRKYSKKNNGPEIISMKFYDGKLNSHVDISQNYQLNNKKVVLLQISPYRTDFYKSPEGKYKFVTIRYSNVFYKKTINKYTIDKDWYEEQKNQKGISDEWEFICSLHHDELIGVKKKDGDKYVYDLSTEKNGYQRKYKGEVEILKYTATNNDLKNVFEVKPVYTYCKKQLMLTSTTFEKIQKYATDVLGNLYEVKDNVLKLEFD